MTCSAPPGFLPERVPRSLGGVHYPSTSKPTLPSTRLFLRHIWIFVLEMKLAKGGSGRAVPSLLASPSRYTRHLTVAPTGHTVSMIKLHLELRTTLESGGFGLPHNHQLIHYFVCLIVGTAEYQTKNISGRPHRSIASERTKVKERSSTCTNRLAFTSTRTIYSHQVDEQS